MYPCILVPTLVLHALFFGGCGWTKGSVKLLRGEKAIYQVTFFVLLHFYALNSFEVRKYEGTNNIFHATDQVPLSTQHHIAPSQPRSIKTAAHGTGRAAHMRGIPHRCKA